MEAAAEHAQLANARIAPRDVARVFFRYDTDGRVVEMRGLTLRNHLTCVRDLASQWDFMRAFDDERLFADGAERRWRLVQAASRHDEGKPGRFRLKADGRAFTYSFAGHRFDVLDDDPYVQWLIRLHHDFSLAEVTKAQAELRGATEAEIRAIADSFPLDLYALEMCDQIEAEIASQVFDTPSGRQRVFMEFEVYPLNDRQRHLGDQPQRFAVFPYPFRDDETPITFESYTVAVSPDAPQAADDLRRMLLSGSAEWDAGREVVLCPLA